MTDEEAFLDKRTQQLKTQWLTGTWSGSCSGFSPSSPPKRFSKADWDSLDPSVKNAVLPFVKRDFNTLMLSGPTRAGKTHAAWGTVFGCLLRTEKCLAVDWATLYQYLFNATGFPSEDQRSAGEHLRAYRNAGLLFLDEFGLSAITNPQISNGLFKLLNDRYNVPECFTIFTTSKPKELLVQEFGAPLVDTRVFGSLSVMMNKHKAVEVKRGVNG